MCWLSAVSDVERRPRTSAVMRKRHPLKRHHWDFIHFITAFVLHPSAKYLPLLLCFYDKKMSMSFFIDRFSCVGITNVNVVTAFVNPLSMFIGVCSVVNQRSWIEERGTCSTDTSEGGQETHQGTHLSVSVYSAFTNVTNIGCVALNKWNTGI